MPFAPFNSLGWLPSQMVCTLYMKITSSRHHAEWERNFAFGSNLCQQMAQGVDCVALGCMTPQRASRYGFTAIWKMDLKTFKYRFDCRQLSRKFIDTIRIILRWQTIRFVAAYISNLPLYNLIPCLFRGIYPRYLSYCFRSYMNNNFYFQARWVANHLGPMIRNSPFKDVKIFGADEQRYLLHFYIVGVSIIF